MVAPYGVYDIAANHGWVSIGVDATAAFAVESIRRWWQKLGRARYPDAHSLTITADCGGSNGVRVKLWKRELQRFANEAGLTVTGVIGGQAIQCQRDRVTLLALQPVLPGRL